jgi:ubiquinone/menaquinone biosynthesis C-methylase UbiE
MASSLPDWQLPPGVNRGLWDYVHDPAIARHYDTGLAGSTLTAVDVAFTERYFDRPGRLLDLGCGTGRLLLPFARRGFRVVGIDLSEEMLKTTRRRAAEADVAVELVRANIVELGIFRDASFEYAACLFSTLGMVVGREERRRVVAHVYRLLRPGGTFVLHVHNRWFNAWNRPGRAWLVANAVRSSLGIEASGDRTMPVHQGVAGLTLHLFTRAETVRLLRAAGFEVVQVRPLSLRPEGRLPWAWWFGWLRAYGYVVAARRPG